MEMYKSSEIEMHENMHYHRNFNFNIKRLKQTVYNWKDSLVI